MKTKASALTLLVFLIFYSFSFGQGGSFSSSGGSPSPGSSTLGQQGKIPMNLYGGSAQVSVPLISAKANHLSTAVSLTYNTQGVKVEQMASNVGLGWGLGAGGVITRSVNGLPDDVFSLNYTSSGIYANNVGYLYDSGYTEGLHALPPWQYSDADIERIENNTKDSEPDVFSFSFGGYSGQFVFNESGECKLFSDQDIKISHVLNNNLDLDDDVLGFTSPYSGGIEEFSIQTPDGMKYIFSKLEKAYSKSKTYTDPGELFCNSQIPLYSFEFTQNYLESNESRGIGYISAWHLTEVVNSYEDTELKFEYNETEVIPDNVMLEQHYNPNGDSDEILDCDFSDETDNPDILTFYSVETAVVKPRLTRILYGRQGPYSFDRYGDIQFVYDTEDREDVYYPPGVSLGSYDKTRALKKVEWRTSRKLLTAELNYSYFYADCLNSFNCLDINGQATGEVVSDCDECIFGCDPILSSSVDLAHAKRLKLESVQIKGLDKDGSEQVLPLQTFEYNEEIRLPSRMSFSQDLWGYYNGEAYTWDLYLPKLYVYPFDDANNTKYQSMYSVFPRTTNVTTQYITGYADRSADEAIAQAGILNRINYPTGGFAEISYGLHEFEFDGTTIAGGGLRIEQMRTSDGAGSDNIQTYDYTNDEGETSGKLINFPHFAFFNGCLELYCNQNQIQEALNRNTSIFSNSKTPIGTTYGTPVGYTKVTATNGSAGYTENYFNVSAYVGIEAADDIYERAFAQHDAPWGATNCENKLFPFPLNPNYDWSNGLMLLRKGYGPEGIVLKEEFEYEWVDFEKINTVKSRLNFVEGFYGIGERYISVGKSFFLSGDKRLTKITNTTYGEEGGELVSETNYEYNSTYHKLATSVWTTNSDGDEYRTEKVYVTDATGEENWEQAAIDELKSDDRYRIYTMLEERKLKNGTLIGGSKVKYRKHLNNTGNGYVIAPYEHYYRGVLDWVLGSTTYYYAVNNNRGFLDKEEKPGYNPTIYTWFKGNLRKKLIVNDNASWNWEWEYEYNDARLLESATDPNGQTVVYHYDGVLRQKQIETKNGAVTSTKTYNLGGVGNNFITTFTDFGNQQTNNTETQYSIEYFDGLGRPTRIDALGHSPTNGNVTMSNQIYDDQGRVVITENLQSGTTSTSYDGSPLGRIKSISTSAPGSVEFNYLINSEAVAGYPAGSLFKKEVIDENGHVTTTFKDKIGRKIAVKDALDGWTYYQYDAYNRLQVVIPPGATENDVELIYGYFYDIRHRVIDKWIPGAGRTFLIYNNKDELILTQDAKMRAEDPSKWIATQYDYLGRSTATGYYTGNPNLYSEPAQPYLTTTTYDEGVGASRGKVTAGSTIVLNPNGTFGETLNSEVHYDDYGRVIKTIGDNHLDGKETVSTSYDNSDKVGSEQMSHNSSLGSAKVDNIFDYDHGGRNEKLIYSINQNPSQMFTYSYNGKDQLIEKNIHKGFTNSPGGTAPVLQSIDYGYNSRGWINYINPIRESQPQNKLLTCSDIPTEDCTIQIEPDEPKCDLECKAVDVSLEDFLTIRLEENDIRVDCYIPCECEKEREVKEKPACSPSEILNQQASLAGLKNEMSKTNPELLNYPTRLYQIKLCGGEEYNVLKEEMPFLTGTYSIMKEVEILSKNQELNIRNEDGNSELVSFPALLNLREGAGVFVDNNTPNEGGPTPFLCPFVNDVLAKSVGMSTAFSSYFGDEPYLDITAFYPGAENSMEDDGNYWYIGKSIELLPMESEWDIQYSFGNQQDIVINSYYMDIEASAIQIARGKVRFGLHDGNAFIPINGGQTFIEINGPGKPANLLINQRLTPDVLPSQLQVENMRLAIMTESFSAKESLHISFVSGEIGYSSSCQENCEQGPNCTEEETNEQKASLVELREGMDKLTVNDIRFPTTIYRLRLCDKSEINVFEQELDLIKGTYLVLDEVELQSSLQKVTVDYGDPDKRDLFMLSLNYFSQNSDLDAPVQRNGNIVSMRWRVAKQSIKAYGFQYDALNRLKKANFGEYVIDDKNRICELGLGAYDVYGDDTGETIRYDARGNIENLKRKGALSTCGNNSYDYGIIDDITYDYLSGTNELRWVDEQASEEKGFINGVATGGDFDYDENGNMTYDPHKNISITYNYLNLPIQISSNEGTIQIWYNANGTKLKTETTSPQGTTIRDYAGITEYVNSTLESIYFGEGRAIPNASGSFTYQHVLSDHLGNSRISFADLNNNGIIEVADNPGGYTEIMQEDHYYPFGMKQEGSWTPTTDVKNRYQYNGIEHEDLLGLNINMATYRTLDPSIGRWWGVDPATESAYNTTPYNSMWNNPVKNIDPEGDLAFLPIMASAFLSYTANVVLSPGETPSFGNALAHLAVGAANGALGQIPGKTIPFGNSGLSFSVKPQIALGTDGVGIGFNANLGYLGARGLRAGINFGASYYASATGTRASGFEARFGYGVGYEGRIFQAGVGSTFFASGGTSQLSGYGYAGGKNWKATYENDTWAPVPGLWDIQGAGRARDRYRTSALQFEFTGGKLKGAKAGVRMFTGFADGVGAGGPNGTFIGNNTDRFRLGVAFLGYYNLRLGLNSERNIRGPLQNGFHDLNDFPRFRVLNTPDRFYGGFYSPNPYTLW